MRLDEHDPCVDRRGRSLPRGAADGAASCRRRAWPFSPVYTSYVDLLGTPIRRP